MKSRTHIARIGLIIGAAADRQLLAAFLEQTGFHVDLLTCRGMPSASDLAVLAACSLVMVDEAAAQQWGAKLEQLRNYLQPRYLPLLLTLGANRPATPWLRAGFDDVLRVPITKDDLLARLETFLRLRRHADAVVCNSERDYRGMFDLAPVGILHLTLDQKITLANACFCDMLRYQKTTFVGRPLRDFIAPEDQPLMEQACSTVLAQPDAISSAFDQRYRREDGVLLWTVVKVSVVRNAEGEAKYLIAVIEDISQRKVLEQTLQESERFGRSTIDALSEHICVIDDTGSILAVNQAWRNFCASDGSVMTDWIGSNYLAVCDSTADHGLPDSSAFSIGLRDVLLSHRDEFSLEYPCGSAENEQWFVARVTRFQLGGPVRAVVSHENVTQAKLAQRHLLYLAHYDNLTGLANRLLFYDRLRLTLRQADRIDWTVAVMFIDLDNFKLINDTLGHAAGDELLQQASIRIVNCLRGNDTVGRLGGDEFGIFLSNLADERDASLVAEKIMLAMAQPFSLGAAEHFVTCSIGISIYPADGSDADALICSADTAMYRAKQMGRNGYQYFTAHMNAQIVERVQLDRGLRMALERKELYLEYQPQCDLRTGRIVGVEALMRWRHPELGTVSPASFIPIAEESGLIVPIGEWAMREACHQNRAWQHAGIPPLVMAVNLSARQFRDKNLEEMVPRVLREADLDARWLELELTEGIVMDNTEAMIATMHSLKTIGVRLSLDDFGTGYSNLGYLKRFPLDTLKIDRSFISGIRTDNEEAIIAATIIVLGHNLRLSVIAEGVETAEQRDLLCTMGCDVMQGDLFSRPLSAAAMTEFLQLQFHSLSAPLPL